MKKEKVVDIIQGLFSLGFSEELIKYLVRDRYKEAALLCETPEVKEKYQKLNVAAERYKFLMKRYNEEFQKVSQGSSNEDNLIFLQKYDHTETHEQHNLYLTHVAELTVLFQRVEPDFPIYNMNVYSSMYERYHKLISQFF